MKPKLHWKRVVFISCVVICIALLAYSLYHALVIYIPQRQEQERFEQLREMIAEPEVSTSEPQPSASESSENNADPASDYSFLKNLNQDAVGWLHIDDTVIDYPVMKSSEDDPEYYLHRDFDKNYSFSGSLFIGEGCDASSDVFIIYGHNMSNGSMFGELDAYRDEAYAQSHRDIILDTMTEHRVYRVFAAFESKIYDEPTDAFEYYNAVGNCTQERYREIVREIGELSLIRCEEQPAYPAQILLLSTCSYHTEDGRFVTAAYRVA